jgi:hypothetical protein
LPLGLTSQTFWDTLRKLADRVRVTAEFVTAVVLLLGAVAGFWPQISPAVHRVSGWLAAGPWWLKYAFLACGLTLSIWLYVRRKNADEDVRVLDCRMVLTIADREGRHAKIEESTLVQARVNEVDSYIHRQWGHGAHAAPQIWAEGYASSVKSLGIREGLDVFALEFDPPLRRGMKIWQHYRCEVTDTFLKPKEFLQHRPHYREKNCELEVCFPPERLPSKVRALFLFGETSRERAILKPVVGKNGQVQSHRYIWHIGRTTPDRRYRIEWEW